VLKVFYCCNNIVLRFVVIFTETYQMKQFYLHDGRHKHGPYLPEELLQFQITKQTKVFAVDINQWILAGEIKELNMLFQGGQTDSTKSWKKVQGLWSKIKGKQTI
jgi:hypothetical protein